MVEIPTKLSTEVIKKYKVDRITNSFKQTPKDDWKDRVEVILGDDKDLTTVQPQAKIQRWDNEVNFSVRLKDFTGYTVTTEAEEIKFKTAKREVHLYDITPCPEHEEGGFEFEILLREKPATNKIEFTLVDKDVEYFYQPPLTQEEIGQGARRPENVVGSYAIYAKTPKTNWTGGKEYKIGKVGHIFRPKIIDSIGTEAWGDLHIENGTLSVTIPADFLSNAVYPVRHAAGLTFGFTSDGGSDSFANADNIFGSYFAAPATGNVTSISVLQYNPGFNNTGIMCAIYNNSDLSLNGATEEKTFTVNASPQWITLNITSGGSITNGVDYLLVTNRKDGYSNMRADTGGTDIGMNKGQAYGTWPDPIVTPTIRDLRFSIYATYTEGGTATNSERAAKLIGNATSSSIRSSKVTGKSTSNGERLAKTTGKSTTSSERGAKITGSGIAQYTRQAIATLPVDDTDLATSYTAQDYIDVATDDDTTVDLTGNGIYFIHEFKNKNDSDTDNISGTWKGQGNLAPSSSSVLLQVYNRTTDEWETIDTESAASANTEFTLTGTVTASLDNYYDISNWVSFRVYQEVA